MDSADSQNRSDWRGRLRERLVKQAKPSVEENNKQQNKTDPLQHLAFWKSSCLLPPFNRLDMHKIHAMVQNGQETS